MSALTKKKAAEEQALALMRRLGDLRAIAFKLKRSRMTPLQVCEAIIEKRFAERTVREFFADLPDDERHYWIASLYALLMPKVRRKRLAAYFTPPHLARHAIHVMMDAGIRPGHHRILDPASGGAAFLVPLASHIVDAGHECGARPKTILQDIQRSLRGVEIDAGLAGLSRALLGDLLKGEIENSGIKLNGIVQCADTLQLERPAELYDAVIGNPPYGRILQPRSALLHDTIPLSPTATSISTPYSSSKLCNGSGPAGLSVSSSRCRLSAGLISRPSANASCIRHQSFGSISSISVATFSWTFSTIYASSSCERMAGQAVPRNQKARCSESANLISTLVSWICQRCRIGACGFCRMPTTTARYFDQASRRWRTTVILPKRVILFGTGRNVDTGRAEDRVPRKSRFSGRITSAPIGDVNPATMKPPSSASSRLRKIIPRSFTPMR